MSDDEQYWYAVRCVFEWKPARKGKRRLYEERITLWRASSFDEAIAKAEAEAKEYVEDAAERGPVPARYLSFAQAYRMNEWDELGEGVEVFSMMRESGKKPREYLDRFFDTGRENNAHVEP